MYFSEKKNGGETGSIPNCLDSLIAQVRHPQLRDSGVGEKASIAKLFEQGEGQA